MSKLLELISRQRDFLHKKGYNNNDLDFQELPDNVFLDLLDQVSEGILKEWPENKPFEFSIKNAGNYKELGGIAYLQFHFQYVPDSCSLKLTKLNVQFYKKSIDVDISTPEDLPHSSEIPQLLTKPVALRRKYNIQTRTKYGLFTRAPHL
ncbi:MAG: hypothetical protein KF746_21330 [Chitinophagaceae bacterium]|nr:hypothetical protein [Chitinophagaceae bacterium]